MAEAGGETRGAAVTESGSRRSTPDAEVEGTPAEAEQAADAGAAAAKTPRQSLLMLSEALEHLVRGIVNHPDDVAVRDKDQRRGGKMLEVRVNPEDIGKVIGRQGRTATALRTVVGALAGREQVRIDFVDVDRPARRPRS